MQERTNSPAKTQVTGEQTRYEAKTSSDIAIESAAKSLTRRQIIKDASEFVKKCFHKSSISHLIK